MEPPTARARTLTAVLGNEACEHAAVNQPREEARHGNQQQTQEVDNASVALTAGMHFAGGIEGFPRRYRRL